MSSSLPIIGVQAIVQGVQQFTKDINAVNKAIDDSGKTASSSANNISPFNDALGEIAPIAIGVVAGITAIVGALVALGKGFLDLANRGVAVQQLGTAFDHLTASVGVDSQKLLKDLQTASDGTIANVDLLRTANTALLGVSGQFGTKFGQALPEFLKVAKVESDATGRSVNELFNNIVEGVKKGTPRLIQSTGLVIDQKKAFQDYAEQLGITVKQLSQADKQQALLNATLAAGKVTIDSMAGSVESNADKLERLNASTTNILDGIGASLQPIFGSIIDGVQKIINGLATFAPYVSVIFEFVGKVISKIVNFIAGAFSNPNIAKNMFEGAAAVFGSFANGIIQTANKLIFPAIIFIAKTIADFLIGLSPPPKGPLSVIDKGGENLMIAWLDGISGVSLDPVTQVAQEVSDALGSIGKESLVQVNTRLSQLDKALLPFQNRLAIIQSQFDALNAPAKAALDAIDTETAKLQDAVAQGNPEAVEKLKILDQQRQVIQDQVDAQQALVDGATIQLGLAQAQQAPERALLTIQKTRLEAIIAAQTKVPVGTVPKEPKAPKAPAGAAPIDTNTGIVTPGLPIAGAPSVLDTLGGQDAIDQAKAGLKTAFEGQIDTGGLAQFGLNEKQLSTQIGRINSVDIGQKISDKFKGISDAFDPSVAGSVANNIFQFFNGDARNPNSIAGIFAHAIDAITPAINTLEDQIRALFANIFDPTIEGSPANIVTILTADAKTKGSMASFFADLPQNVSDAASGLWDQLKKDVFQPVIDFMVGGGPGSIGDIINQVVTSFASLPAGIVGALSNLGGIVYNAVVVPIINVMNTMIDGLQSAIRGVASTIAGFLASIISGFDNATIGSTNLGGLVPQGLRNFASGIAGFGSSFTIPHISTALPAFLAPPAGEKGGLFGEGLFKVGEKGPEYLFSGKQFGVLPNQLTKVLESLSTVLAQPQAQPIYAGGGNTTMNNSSSSFNFNGVQSDNDARRRYNYLRAGMR